MNIFSKTILYLVKRPFAAKMIHRYFLRRWKKESVKYAAARNIRQKPRLCWGTAALISNMYWSEAMKLAGYPSQTVMHTFYPSINKKEDFDLYIEELVRNNYPSTPGFIKYMYPEYFAFDYILRNYDILHTSCDGVTYSLPKELEAHWLKQFGVRTIVMPYGGDMYSYSKLINVSRRHAIQVNYPEEARREDEINHNVNTWVRHCDIFLPGFQIDGIGRWDLLPCSFVTIDEKRIKSKTVYSDADGKKGEVVIIHAPNHRGAKGTDYVIHAVEQLRNEGLKVRLKLIEKMANDQLLKVMHDEADIVVEELIGSFYGLFGIETMATGLPLVTNLDSEEYTRFLRRFSYLNESPIVSATAENAIDILRVLITNPELRKELGVAGRHYAEKYHSEKAARFMFERIYDRIWYNKEVDLMNLYHPLKKDSYNNQSPKVAHPLFENRIPEKYYPSKTI